MSSSVSDDINSGTSLTEVIIEYLNNLLAIFLNLLGVTCLKPSEATGNTILLTENQNSSSIFSNLFTEFLNWLAFDDFQLTLLKGFLLVLACNFVFICLAWHLYGQKISQRFMRPATSKTIQDIQKSVSKLKLPSEHTPRF